MGRGERRDRVPGRVAPRHAVQRPGEPGPESADGDGREAAAGCVGSRSGYGAGARLQQQRRERVVARADVGQPCADAERARHGGERGRRVGRLPGDAGSGGDRDCDGAIHDRGRHGGGAGGLHGHERDGDVCAGRDAEADGAGADRERRRGGQRRDVPSGAEHPDGERCEQRGGGAGRRGGGCDDPEQRACGCVADGVHAGGRGYERGPDVAGQRLDGGTGRAAGIELRDPC